VSLYTYCFGKYGEEVIDFDDQQNINCEVKKTYIYEERRINGATIGHVVIHNRASTS
jgi:hypothetical protein